MSTEGFSDTKRQLCLNNTANDTAFYSNNIPLLSISDGAFTCNGEPITDTNDVYAEFTAWIERCSESSDYENPFFSADIIDVLENYEGADSVDENTHKWKDDPYFQ